MLVNVVIIDDHAIVRQGIKQLLELDESIKVVGEAGDGVIGLETIKQVEPDIILLDINMPNMNGLEVLRKLKEKRIHSKVLILTIHNEVEYLLKAVDIGADGYVLKDSELSILKKAIFTVNDGERYIQPSLTPLLKEGVSELKEEKGAAQELTKRELEVLRLIAKGLYNKEIAEQLLISEKTVKNHVSNIFKKIDVSDRTQAAIYAIKNNIVEI